MPLDTNQRTLNPEHVKRVIALTNKTPFFVLIGLKITEMGSGYCKAEVELDTKHYNAFGNVHGGAYAAFVDSVSYYTLYCDIPEDCGAVTLDLHVDDVRGAKEGLVTIEGRVIKLGRTICMTEAEARDEQGRLLVRCESKQMLAPGLQPISDAVEALHEDPLPPKFLD